MQDVHGDIILVQACLKFQIDAVIKINNLKSIRYCIKVTVCKIYKKIKEAYLKIKSRLLLIQRLDKRSTECNMAFVWQLIFNVEILLLLFGRS